MEQFETITHWLQSLYPLENIFQEIKKNDFLHYGILTVIGAEGVKVLSDFKPLFTEPFASQSEQSEQIAVMVTGLNEIKAAPATIESLLIQGKFKRQHIFYVDDGSSDGTREKLINLNLIPVENILTDKNLGKPHAMHRGAKHIKSLDKYKWILTLDADIEFADNGIIPLDDIEKQGFNVASFNIVPVVEKEHGHKALNRTFVDLHKMEYGSSMAGRKSLARKANVNCASGAAALYELDLYLKILEEHTKVFTGDDQESTLLALNPNLARITYLDIPIYTHSPSALSTWWTQRTKRWWPGTFRNMKKVNSIIFNKDKAKNYDFSLRFNMFWEQVSVYLDIPKFLYLIYVAYSNTWLSLVSVYLFYVGVCIFKYKRLKKYEDFVGSYGGKYELGNIHIPFLYPFYALLNSGARIKALFIYLKKRFLEDEWSNERTKHVTVCCLFLCTLSFGQTQDQQKIDTLATLGSVKVDYNYGYVSDSGNSEQTHNQHLFRVDYSKNYIQWTSRPLNTISIGRYQKIKWNKDNTGVVRPEISYRYVGEGWAIGTRYTHYWKYKVIPYLNVSYYINGRPTVLNGGNVTILTLGGFTQVNKNWRSGLGLFQDLTDSKKTTLVVTNIYRKKNLFIENYLIIGTKQSHGFNLRIGYGNFYIHSGYNNNIDFSELDRFTNGIGYKKKFNFKNK